QELSPTAIVVVNRRSVIDLDGAGVIGNGGGILAKVALRVATSVVGGSAVRVCFNRAAIGGSSARIVTLSIRAFCLCDVVCACVAACLCESRERMECQKQNEQEKRFFHFCSPLTKVYCLHHRGEMDNLSL